MTKQKSKRNRIFLIAAILVVAGLGVWYLIAAKSSPKKTASTTPTTKTDVANTDDANKNDPTLDKKAEPTTSTTATKAIYLTVSRPVNNDTIPLSEGLEVRSVVSGATSGSCTLTGTGPNGKSISKTSTIAAQTSYGSCSFDVASSEISVGDWRLTLAATSGSATAKSNFNIQVTK